MEKVSFMSKGYFIFTDIPLQKQQQDLKRRLLFCPTFVYFWQKQTALEAYKYINSFEKLTLLKYIYL